MSLPSDHEARMRRAWLSLDGLSVGDAFGQRFFTLPATVALFRLGRTLKYKNKPGRTLDQLRDELLSLVHHLEGLADAPTPLHLDHPAWRDLVTRAEEAGSKADLRRVATLEQPL